MRARDALLVGLLLVIVFDIVQVILSYGNPVLFSVGIFCILITIVGLVINLSAEDDLQLKWMLVYVIPAGVLVAGMLLRLHEVENSIITQIGHDAIRSPLPGQSSDYERSVYAMFFSFTIPVQVFLVNAIYSGIKLGCKMGENRNA